MIELRLLGSPIVEGLEPAQGEALLRQPKRLAVLVRLALAPRDTYERRDNLLAMFWPEQSEERGRHALRQTLHSLRAATGRQLIARRGDDELAVDPQELTCDAAIFEQLLDENRRAEALAVYRGDLLPGFFLDDAPGFDRWLDDTRGRLRHRAASAAGRLADERENAGDLSGAADWARRAQELAPDDEGALRRLLVILDRAGNRAGAMQAYERFTRRLSEDLEVEPSTETQVLAQALRLRSAAPTSSVPAAYPEVEARHDPSAPASGARSAPHAHGAAPRLRLPLLVAGGSALAAVAAFFWLRPAPESAEKLPPITVTTSAMARRLYDEGMRAFTAGNREGAERLMRAAVEEDSTFGMAMLQLGHLLGLRGEHAEGQRIQTAALRLAPRQSDRERLRIQALFADHFSDPRLRVFAETLAIRYPADLEGQYLVAKGRHAQGEFLGAVDPLRRVIAGDSSRGPAPRECPSCDAFLLLTQSYEHADSLAAAERTARAWIRAHPTNVDAWNTLSYQLSIQDRYTEAIAAARRAGDIAPARTSPGAIDEILLRAGDFATLGNVLGVRLASGNRDDASGARFLHWRLLREKGRFREAEEFTRAHPDLGIVPRTESLAEVGRFGEALALWDSATARLNPGPEPASSFASLRAGYRIRSIDLLAQLRDTIRLAREIALLRSDVERSGLERIRRISRHAEGMLLLARGDVSGACTMLRSAMFSATSGYVKTYLFTARACLEAQRPAEAVPALRGVIRGPVGASGTAGSFTQAHEMLGRAFLALGVRDSARVHFRRVAEAWASADEPMRTRAAAARGESLGATP